MTTETIEFNERKGRDGFVFGEEAETVNIITSPANQKMGTSSKVKLTNVVDYSWDAQFGIGRITASHYTQKYIAYCVKVGGIGAVRVVDLETKDRVLMRGNRGLIRDVEFMHKADEILLGFIDEYGSFYIYRLERTPKLQTVLLLNVELEGSASRLECRRFIWCRYVPDDGGDPSDPDMTPARDSPSYQFAIIENDLVYVANLLSVIAKYGEGVHSFPSLKGAYLTIREHSKGVVDASFAPDGTAIATASRDGTVKFFQIYFLSSDFEGEPRCLYSWSPHDGEPVSRIFFLDDHTLTNNDTESQYWKFVITAGPNMSELKLWNCMKWECVQTLRFSSTSPTTLRMDMNITANFFILADSERKVLYVLHVEHDENAARFNWITEFSIPVPVLAFNVCNAEFCKMRKILERGFENFLGADVSSNADACMVDIIFVQPKSLMEAAMAFRPPVPVEQIGVGSNGRTHSRISFDDSVSFKDEDEKDSDVEEVEVEDEEEIEEEESPEPPPKARRSLSPLRGTPSKIPSPKSAPSVRSRDMSPGSHNPILKATPTSVTSVSHLTKQLSSLIGVGLSPNPPSAHANPFSGSMVERNDVTLPIRVRTSSTNGNVSNASSSPSREVEEILSPKNTEALIHKSEVSAFLLLDTGFGGTVPMGLDQGLDIEGNLIDLRSGKSESPKSNLPLKTKSLGGGELVGSPQIPQVLEQINSIMDMMKAQAQELKELKSEVSRLNGAQLMNSGRSLDESIITRALEKYTALNDAHLRRNEESIKTTVMALEKRGVPKGFTENVTLDLAHAIKTEIESTVLPQLLKVFEPVCLHLNSEIDSMVKGAETKVKQQMGQMVNSHEFKSMLRDQVAGSVKSVCDGAMSDVFSASICPNFEKSLKGLFETINETFMKGTKEYMSGVETSVNTSRSQHEDLQDSLKRQFSTMQDTLGSVLQVEVESQMRQIAHGLRDGLLTQFEDTVAVEIARAFAEQQRFFELSVIPRTATPAGLSDSMTMIGQSPAPVDPAVRLTQLNALLESGDITGAFTKGASVGDHHILMSLATKVPPSLVFTRDLPSVAHLSIIQQMATDITTYTETKLLYLQNAVGTLNLSDPNVLRSLNRIIPVFQNSVSRFAAGNPDSPYIGNLRFLEMAFVGIGNRSQQPQLTSHSALSRSQL